MANTALGCTPAGAPVTTPGEHDVPPGKLHHTCSVVMGRNTLQYFRQQIALRRTANIAEGKDANHPLALVDHWQAAHFQLFHVPYRLGEIIVFLAAMDASGHHVERRRPA